MLSYCLYIETVVAASYSWWDGLPGGWTCKYGHQSKVGMRTKPTTEGGKTMMFHVGIWPAAIESVMNHGMVMDLICEIILGDDGMGGYGICPLC